MGDHLKIYNYSVLISKLDLNIDRIVLAHKSYGLFKAVHLRKILILMEHGGCMGMSYSERFG